MDQRQESDVGPQVDQPGLGELREAVENYSEEQLPGRPAFHWDVIAGLNGAFTSVPDGMAAALLAGVSPIYGLHACMVGPVVGGIFTSTQLMVINTTSAASLAAGQALISMPAEARENSLFLMVILTGIFQLLSGLLRLGWLTCFVSYSVMNGFVAGIVALTILSQLPNVTGYQPSGGNWITRNLDLLANFGQVNPMALAVSALTLLLAVTLPRTGLKSLANLLSIAVPSFIVALIGASSVRTVRDIGEVSGGIPMPSLPSLSGLTLDALTGAMAIAIIILVQSAGVSQSVPNPDGTRRSPSRDFFAEGAANVASGLFQGLPVGGSLGSTSISVISGARTRWAAILTGVWVGGVVVLFPGLVSYVALPALAMLLIVASARIIKLSDELSIWNTGWPSRIASITTFLCTLLLPIQIAVGIGVAISVLIQLTAASADVSVVELLERPDGRIEERKAARQLPSNRVTVLDIYGHLFFASTQTLERLLPSPEGAQNPVVILRMRGRTTVGATLVNMLKDYANKLEGVGGRLYLTGISPGVHDQLVRTRKLRLFGPVRVYEATPIVGQSTRRALADAQAWLVSRGEE
ncbi:MAG: SulP family inorganic anion transporter [Chloroflexota bacterium]|jgi:SulP family sulfate permease